MLEWSATRVQVTIAFLFHGQLARLKVFWQRSYVHLQDPVRCGERKGVEEVEGLLLFHQIRILQIPPRQWPCQRWMNMFQTWHKMPRITFFIISQSCFLYSALIDNVFPVNTFYNNLCENLCIISAILYVWETKEHWHCTLGYKCLFKTRGYHIFQNFGFNQNFIKSW